MGGHPGRPLDYSRQANTLEHYNTSTTARQVLTMVALLVNTRILNQRMRHLFLLPELLVWNTSDRRVMSPATTTTTGHQGSLPTAAHYGRRQMEQHNKMWSLYVSFL